MEPAEPRTRASGTVPTSREEMGAVLSNLYGAYATWVLQRPNAHIVPSPDLTLIDSGRPIPEFNIAFVESVSTGWTGIQRAAEYFSARGRSWRLETPSEIEAQVDAQAAKVGLTARTRRPGFLLRPAGLVQGATPEDLEIAPVRSSSDVPVFLATMVEGMSGAPPSPSPPPSRTELPDFLRFLGRVDGIPVATSAAFLHRGVAGVYAVGVISKWRGRGYGRAITERAIRTGFELGCTLGFLQSTPMAESVYEAMGFRWAFDRAVWQRPAST